MFQEKINTSLLYEPRLLFRKAAQRSLEARGYTVLEMGPGMLAEEVFVPAGDTQLIAIGLSSVGREIDNLLRVLHRLSALQAHIVVWLSEGDDLLVRLMHGLGVHSIRCETYLYEELSERGLSEPYLSSHWPERHANPLKGDKNRKLSISELNTLIDSSRGMSANEIASFRHTSYKTVFTHKRNALQRLNLENSAQWLDLLARIEQIRSF